MNIDYGYALNGLINNRLDYYLVRAEDTDNKKGDIPNYPLLDLFGDVFI